MMYKVGDCVRVQSLERYNKYKNRHGDIHYGCETEILFTSEMSSFCGQVVTITRVRYIGCVRFYHLVEDKGVHLWVDGMFEGLVEEENEKKLSDESWRYENIFDNSQYPQSFECPEGCVFKDENGNVINASKIVLEKKNNDKLKLESTKKVREYWNEYTRIFIEIYDDEPNECILTHLYTIEKYRQKGYARKALAEAELIAKELGCHTVHLKVETNSWMYNWYLRCGYNWNKKVNEGYTWLIKKTVINMEHKELLLGLASVTNKGQELIPHKDYEIKQDGEKFYLVKKKKEYPKTYKECLSILGIYNGPPDVMICNAKLSECELFESLIRLKRCRDAYWKIAGEEIGLGKPWEPDYNDLKNTMYGLYDELKYSILNPSQFVFPTKEMRDAFKENFDPDIEICKELL